MKPNFRQLVEFELIELYKRMGIDRPSCHDSILDFVCNDIKECTDGITFNSNDVAIAFRRLIEELSYNLTNH